MNLLRLDGISSPGPDPEPDAQLPLFANAPAAVADLTPHLLPEIDEERATIVSRETFLVSMVVHIAVVIFLVANPDLINLGTPAVVLPKPEEKEVTMLYEPPPPRPRLQAPPEPVQPPAQPMTLPRAAGSPDSQLEKIQSPPGEKLTEPAQPKPPAEPAKGTKDEEQQLARMDPIGIPDFPEGAKTPPERQPSLESILRPEAPPPSEAQLRLPTLSPPSRGTDEILRQMAKQHAEGGQRQGGFSTIVPNPGDPNFSLPGPQILSDTMGVNFDPYLLRVYLSVQRNWYSVIPEIARLGRKGRVILQFTIGKNGGVDDLQLMDGSGTSSMDSAALSSIRLSNPFPPLPPEFPGENIVLRFGYYYNMQPEYMSRP